MRLELHVERSGRRVGDVRVHGVHVQEVREAAPLLQPFERRIHHRPRLHHLRGPVAGAVEAGEEVEPLVEVRPRGIDDGVRAGPPGGDAVGLDHLRERDQPRVQAVAELDGAMAPGKERREYGGHRGLGPARVGDGLVEHDRVAREGHQLRRRVARIAVGRGVVRAQRIHEIDDGERGAVLRDVDPRIAPEGLAGVVLGLEAARLEHELAVAARVVGQVHVHRHPLAVRRPRQRIEKLGPGRLLAAALVDLHGELDARLVVALGGDSGGEAQVRAARDVDLEAIAARRRGVEGGAHDVVDAHPLAGLAVDPGHGAPAHVGLAARGAGAQEVERARRSRARGERRRRRQHRCRPESRRPRPEPPPRPAPPQ